MFVHENLHHDEYETFYMDDSLSRFFQEFICSLELLVTSDRLPQTLTANAKQKLNALYSCDKEQQQYLEIVSQISH